MILPLSSLLKPIITPNSADNDSLSMELCHFASQSASGAWPTANKAIYIPFKIYDSVIVDTLGVFNGATVSGNFDLGVFDGLSLSKLISTGSTAQAGTSQIQVVSVTATELKPGFYFLAVSCDNTTATFSRFNTALLTANFMGVREQTTAFALPATATLAALSSSYIPFPVAFKVGFPL